MEFIGEGMNLFSSSQPIAMNIGLLRIVVYAKVAKYIKDNNLARFITNVTETIQEDEKSETRRLFVKIEYHLRSLKV